MTTEKPEAAAESDAIDQDTPEERQRMRDALGSTPGICRALNEEGTFMCWLDTHPDGDHEGFELPTITLDEPIFPPADPEGGA